MAADRKRLAKNTQRTTKSAGRSRKTPIKLPDEKSIKSTQKTVPVSRRTLSRAQKAPMPLEAVDQRKHFPESDRKTRRPARGGSCQNNPPIPLG